LNRNLLLFALFLIVLGVGFGIYLVSLFGLLMLIPALMATSRPPPRPVSAPSRQASRRIIPPPMPQQMATLPNAETPPLTTMMVPTPQPSAYQSFSPALFPNSMFSYLTPPSTTPPKPIEAPAKNQSERDELIETGAMLAVLKFLLG
jgi:hypothetical protein